MTTTLQTLKDALIEQLARERAEAKRKQDEEQAKAELKNKAECELMREILEILGIQVDSLEKPEYVISPFHLKLVYASTWQPPLKKLTYGKFTLDVSYIYSNEEQKAIDGAVRDYAFHRRITSTRFESPVFNNDNPDPVPVRAALAAKLDEIEQLARRTLNEVPKHVEMTKRRRAEQEQEDREEELRRAELERQNEEWRKQRAAEREAAEREAKQAEIDKNNKIAELLGIKPELAEILHQLIAREVADYLACNRQYDYE